MSENLVERYLTELRDIRATGANVPETSFYPALEGLLTDIGRTLSPKVRCVINLTNGGAGLPDGGFFTADQIRSVKHDPNAKENPFLVQNPARGALEVKPPVKELKEVINTKQVKDYWEKYGLVLVTNLRAFTLIGKDEAGQLRELESYTLAETESEFWKITAHPRKTAVEHGERLLQYLKRVLLHNAPLTQPQDLAAILAAYAHEARLRIEDAELPALDSLRQALEDALGIQFEGEKGKHFFRSTLIQTLFYGVFSAWVFWARRQGAKPGEKSVFDWHTTHWLLRVPMLRALFVQVADPARLGRFGLDEVLDWAAAALNRVNRSEFFKLFREDHAVQYFYEPFLHAFDPELRKELGVWYTPEEIVRYQVERVDAVLRSELGLADGLADPRVVVLDPCCGTGAYLREVLRRIATTLQDKGGDALVAHDLKKAAMERVFGFEILPAPFVIAHLQLGLVLESLGAPLSDSGDPPERAGVYLTNALTGWEPPKEKPKQIAFPGFEEERDAAGMVKQEKPILVILGNPPYNAFAGVSPEEEHGLVEPYKVGLISEWKIKKFNLDELYARFLRLAERRIAEIGGRGVVCFISSFSYISDPSFVVMRKRFLDEFDSIWIDCLNGDSRETGKKTPDGEPDPSVFSTKWNRAGIKLGTAVGLFVKHGRERAESAKSTNLDNIVRFRHFWGRTKREDLFTSLEVQDFDAQYEVSNPRKEFRWNFRPLNVNQEYMSWPQLPEISKMPPTLGILDNRQEALISHDIEKLCEKVKKYLDPEVSWEELTTIIPELTRNYARFDARKAHSKILAKEPFKNENLHRVFMRPLDNRWCYYTSVRPIWTETRPTYVQQCWAGNGTLVSRRKGIADPEGPPFFFASILGMQHSLNTDAYYIPYRLLAGSQVNQVSGDKNRELDFIEMKKPTESITANLSLKARAYLESLGLPDPDNDKDIAGLIWYHTLAIGYSPAYLAENADGIHQNWPRIPLPADRDRLVSSAELGRQIAEFLDTEAPVLSVTAGKIRDDLKNIAVFQRLDGKPAQPNAGDLDLTAGWGHSGANGITMPGKGMIIERSGNAFDIYLNDVACWRNVPESVWNYTIGGYQVIKKWLSYREKPLLCRGLTPEEVRYVTEMARRLAALVALHSSLDDNYRNVSGRTYTWRDQ